MDYTVSAALITLLLVTACGGSSDATAERTPYVPPSISDEQRCQITMEGEIATARASLIDRTVADSHFQELISKYGPQRAGAIVQAAGRYLQIDNQVGGGPGTEPGLASMRRDAAALCAASN